MANVFTDVQYGANAAPAAQGQQADPRAQQTSDFNRRMTDTMTSMSRMVATVQDARARERAKVMQEEAELAKRGKNWDNNPNANVVQGAAQGAGIGAMTGTPWGVAAGAIAGGVIGGGAALAKSKDKWGTIKKLVSPTGGLKASWNFLRGRNSSGTDDPAIAAARAQQVASIAASARRANAAKIGQGVTDSSYQPTLSYSRSPAYTFEGGGQQLTNPVGTPAFSDAELQGASEFAWSDYQPELRYGKGRGGF